VIVSVVVSAHVGNLQPDNLHREATTRRRINRSVNYPSIGLYSVRFISLIVKNTQQACINVEQRFAHAFVSGTASVGHLINNVVLSFSNCASLVKLCFSFLMWIDE